MATANRIVRGPLFIAGVFIAAAIGSGSSSAQETGSTQEVMRQAALQTDHQVLQESSKPRSQLKKPHVATAVAATDPATLATSAKPATKPLVATAVASEKAVEVAGLHPAGDEVPYILGHLMWVPSETGASYGDLDPQYLTANYRVYLNEADAPKVFAYIKHLQATSPLWNAQTTNCTAFIGRIASFMGLKVPFHLQRPENYINELKAINGGRQTAQLSPDAERY